MKSGRPPSWNLTAKAPNLPWREVIALTSRQRLTLPAQIRHRVSWLGGSSSVTCLGVLEEKGLVKIWPWLPKGKAIEERVSRLELEKDLGTQDRNEIALAIQGRYIRLIIDSDGRLVLPLDAISHIDPKSRDSIPFCVIGYLDYVEIMSLEFWYMQFGTYEEAIE